MRRAILAWLLLVLVQTRWFSDKAPSAFPGHDCKNIKTACWCWMCGSLICQGHQFQLALVTTLVRPSQEAGRSVCCCRYHNFSSEHGHPSLPFTAAHFFCTVWEYLQGIREVLTFSLVWLHVGCSCSKIQVAWLKWSQAHRVFTRLLFATVNADVDWEKFAEEQSAGLQSGLQFLVNQRKDL